MSDDLVKVGELRAKFLEEYEKDKTSYDERDVERIKTIDYTVLRFINFLGQGIDKGLEHMKDCYQWRKSYGVAYINRRDFTDDYFEAGAVFPYLPDKEGNVVIHIRPKICNKLKKENAEKLEKYCMQVVNAVDEKVSREFGFGLVMNCGDLGVSDIDLNFIFQILPRLRKYFPNGCKYCVIYGLHWSVNYICKMAVAAMPADSAKKIRFLGKEQELLELIAAENLPDYLKGTASKEYRRFPSMLQLHEQSIQ